MRRTHYQQVLWQWLWRSTVYKKTSCFIGYTDRKELDAIAQQSEVKDIKQRLEKENGGNYIFHDNGMSVTITTADKSVCHEWNIDYDDKNCVSKIVVIHDSYYNDEIHFILEITNYDDSFENKIKNAS